MNLNNNNNNNNNEESDFDQDEIDRICDFLPKPPRGFPDGTPVLHVVVHKLDSGNSGTTCEVITLILKQKGADVNIRDKKFGMTALQCLLGTLHDGMYDSTRAVFELLLKHGADVTAEDDDGWTAMHLVAFNLREENQRISLVVARRLVEEGASVAAQSKTGATPLHLLSKKVSKKNKDLSLAIARLLLERGADVRAQNNRGWTALHCLCRNLKEDHRKASCAVARLLLEEEGADITAQTWTGSTALHVVAEHLKKSNRKASLAISRLLLETGANLRAQTRAGSTPLHCVSGNLKKDNQKASLAVARLFLEDGENGSDLTAQTKTGATVLHVVAKHLKNDNQQTSMAFVRLLLKHGVDVAAQDKDGETALHIICRNLDQENHEASIPFAMLLLEEGTPLEAQDKDGVTPLFVLLRNLKEENQEETEALIRLVQDYKEETDSTAQGIIGYAPLDYIADSLKSHLHAVPETIATLLLEHGVDVTARRRVFVRQGTTTVLHHLIRNLGNGNRKGTIILIRLLLEHKANVHTRNHQDGRTILHILAERYQQQQEEDHDVNTTMGIADLLLTHGADVTAQDRKGKTALHILIDILNDDNLDSTLALVRRLLISTKQGAGADLLNTQKKDGQTILHLLCKKKESKMRRENIRQVLDVFLTHGADPSIHDYRGILPVYYFTDPKLFHPTSVFHLIRSMVGAGFTGPIHP